MASDPELAALFPNLAASLNDWDGTNPPSDDSLSRDPSHGGVTDDQIEAELRRMGALRAPLSPLVSGQTLPPTPEFANRGRLVPPGGQAQVEPPQEPEAPDLAEETGEVPGIPEEEGGESPATPPSSPTEEPPLAPAATAPTAPTAPTVPPDRFSVAGRDYDRSQLEAWAQFDSLVAGDAELRQLISEHLQRRAGQPPSQSIAGAGVTDSPLAPTGLPELPSLPPHYEDDETIKGLYKVVQAQQSLLDRTIRESRQALNQSSSNAQRTYIDITKGAMSEFAARRNLDENTMGSIMKTVVQSGLANTYMRGLDPITGESTVDPRTGAPDPYQAIMRAMDVAYYMVPETRQAEIDRGIQERVDRATKEQTRKQKLAGVSGAAGSVPRTQSIPSDPNDRYSAMVEEMRQMQNGSWIGDGN